MFKQIIRVLNLVLVFMGFAFNTFASSQNDRETEEAKEYLENRYGDEKNWPYDTKRTEKRSESGQSEVEVGTVEDPKSGLEVLKSNMGGHD